MSTVTDENTITGVWGARYEDTQLLRLTDMARHLGLKPGTVLRWAQARIRNDFPVAVDRLSDGTGGYSGKEVEAWIAGNRDAQITVEAAGYGLTEEAYVDALRRVAHLCEVLPYGNEALRQAGLVPVDPSRA